MQLSRKRRLSAAPIWPWEGLKELSVARDPRVADHDHVPLAERVEGGEAGVGGRFEAADIVPVGQCDERRSEEPRGDPARVPRLHRRHPVHERRRGGGGRRHAQRVPDRGYDRVEGELDPERRGELDLVDRPVRTLAERRAVVGERQDALAVRDEALERAQVARRVAEADVRREIGGVGELPGEGDVHVDSRELTRERLGVVADRAGVALAGERVEPPGQAVPGCLLHLHLCSHGIEQDVHGSLSGDERDRAAGRLSRPGLPPRSADPGGLSAPAGEGSARPRAGPVSPPAISVSEAAIGASLLQRAANPSWRYLTIGKGGEWTTISSGCRARR